MRRFTKSLFAVVVALFVVMFPSVASAHAILDASTPASSSVLESSPTEIRLDFNETIEKSLLSIQLFDAEQLPVSIGKATGSDSDA